MSIAEEIAAEEYRKYSGYVGDVRWDAIERSFREVAGQAFLAGQISEASLGGGGKITLHVAVIELDEDMDPAQFVTRSREELETQLRAYIEDLVLNQVVPEHWPEIHAYVTELENEDADWEIWHAGLHELDGTPWVTITTKEV